MRMQQLKWTLVAHPASICLPGFRFQVRQDTEYWNYNITKSEYLTANVKNQMRHNRHGDILLMMQYPNSNLQQHPFISMIFLAHVRGHCTPLKSRSVIVVVQPQQTVHGRNRIYHEAQNPAKGQNTNIKPRNHKIDHNTPGHNFAMDKSYLWIRWALLMQSLPIPTVSNEQSP